MKKSQSSFEFVVIIGIIFMIAAGSISLMQSRMVSISEDNNRRRLGELGNLIRSETLMAELVEGNYTRRFTLPYTIDGLKYSVNVSGPAEVTIKLNNDEYVVFVNYNISGKLMPGVNELRKYTNRTITFTPIP